MGGAAIGLGIVAGVAPINAAGNLASSKAKRSTQKALATVHRPLRDALLRGMESVQHYEEASISRFFRPNDYPPIAVYPQAQGGDDTYDRLLAGHFADYRLDVNGLVEHPLNLSLEDLRALPRQGQTTLHHCIQGWTSIGKWSGVPVRELLRLCRPLPGANYPVFWSFGFHEKPGGVRESTGSRYYEAIGLREGHFRETILAYGLNGETLPIQHGAPLRLRLETKLGFKMVEYVMAIEVVDDFAKVGGGMGGVREDEQQFDMGAEI